MREKGGFLTLIAGPLALKQANAGGVRHGCFVEISDDTISSQR
jgi:hypothetical protein